LNGGARRLLTGRHRLGKDIALDKGLRGPQLAQGPPVHVEGARERSDQQHQDPGNNSLKRHSLFPQPAEQSRVASRLLHAFVHRKHQLNTERSNDSMHSRLTASLISARGETIFARIVL
jgi:hypothetical protein